LYSRGKPLTRLKSNDIQSISSRLEKYNQELLVKTRNSLLGIACNSYNVEEAVITGRAKSFSFHVVPVTAGQGIINDFSETVCAVLRFLGFTAEVTEKSNAAGIALAFEQGADAIFMADDHRFVGLNLHTRSVVDNSQATGRIYSAALDIMAGGIKEHDVLVLGCGPVGEAAACKLLSLGARVILRDLDILTAQKTQTKLSKLSDPGNISVTESINNSTITYRYIVDATPAKNALPNKLLSEDTYVAAPGVPLGISSKGCNILKNRLIHDKLELGVAAMAISILR
jgi:pyrrolysine biosynthesis protein PylD